MTETILRSRRQSEYNYTYNTIFVRYTLLLGLYLIGSQIFEVVLFGLHPGFITAVTLGVVASWVLLAVRARD